MDLQLKNRLALVTGSTAGIGTRSRRRWLAKANGVSFEQFEKQFFEKIRPTSLIKRFAAPEEVASLVAYIASPLSSATTGAALRVEGGLLKSAV